MNIPALAASAPAHPLVCLAAVAALLLLSGAAICMDLAYRRIPNLVCVAVALCAVPYWFGISGWSGMLSLGGQLAISLALTLPLALAFALRLIGGGDVKLILAMVLWVGMAKVGTMALAVAVIGGMLGISLKLLNLVFWRIRTDNLPYGLAIVAGTFVAMAGDLGRLLANACLAAA